MKKLNINDMFQKNTNIMFIAIVILTLFFAGMLWINIINFVILFMKLIINDYFVIIYKIIIVYKFKYVIFLYLKNLIWVLILFSIIFMYLKSLKRGVGNNVGKGKRHVHGSNPKSNDPHFKEYQVVRNNVTNDVYFTEMNFTSSASANINGNDTFPCGIQFKNKTKVVYAAKDEIQIKVLDNTNKGVLIAADLVNDGVYENKWYDICTDKNHLKKNSEDAVLKGTSAFLKCKEADLEIISKNDNLMDMIEGLKNGKYINNIKD